MSGKEMHLEKSDDTKYEISQTKSIQKLDSCFPSPMETESVMKKEEVEEKRPTSSCLGSSSPINSPEHLKINLTASRKDFEQTFMDKTEKSEAISMPIVIEISTPPSPNETETIADNNDTKNPIKNQDRDLRDSYSQMPLSKNPLENTNINSNSSQACLSKNVANELTADNFQLTSLSESIKLPSTSSTIKEITETKERVDPIMIQNEIQNGTSLQSFTPINQLELSDSSETESETIEVVQFISLPRVIEITLPPSSEKNEGTAENMEVDEPIESKDRKEFNVESQDTNYPRKDSTLNKSSERLNEDFKLEGGTDAKPTPPPPTNSRPGILKYPETETTVTKSEFAELLGKLISAIKIDEGIELTVDELSEEIFDYFGGNKEIMEIRLSGEYARGIMSKLNGQETGEKKTVKKTVTFAPENDELEIEPRSRSRSNSLKDKSAEKLRKVRSFIEEIFHL